MEKPCYTCRKTVEEIEIDGNLEKKAWQQAASIALVETATGQPPARQTTAKLLWNEQWLYVGFRCEDDHITASMRGFNDPLYEEEVVEVFIDDDADRVTYLEFEVNPLNAAVHYCVHNNLQGHVLFFGRLERVIQSAVALHLDAGFYTVEIAIPVSEFITARQSPPLPGDRWLMNLYRIKRPRGGPDEYSAWQPTGEIEFHLPDRFGVLSFGAG